MSSQISALAGDARYSTRNTNLAACIGSLKIPVKSEQPITRVKDEATGNLITTFWFERTGAEEFCGSTHDALEIEKCWNNRQLFESQYPNHPLIPMRKVLDKRDWLNKAWHGRIIPATSMDKAGYVTEDLFFASVLMASGFPILRLDKPRYCFRKLRKDDLEKIESDCRHFEMYGVIERPTALMRRALEARKLLVALARHPGIETQLKFADGMADKDAGRIAFISDKASDEQVSKTLDALYE